MEARRNVSPTQTPMGRGNGPRPFGGPGAMGMPVQKAKNFKVTLYRLIAYFKPHAWLLLTVFIAAVFGTVFTIISPKILASATNVLAPGIMSKFGGHHSNGVNFSALIQDVLLLFGVYVFSSLFSFVQQYLMAGVAQKTVYTIRKQVNDKLSRLPLRYFDSHPHGDIMSRFINDFDNISNTLQQSLTQLITSVITFIGVIVMMLTISPLMTVVVFLTLPLSFVIIRVIASRSQRYFMAQQKTLGKLNGHVEEMFTGHVIVKAFGHEKKSVRRFHEINEELYEAGWKAQFVSGIIMPLMNFIGNLGFVLVSVIGGILVTKSVINIGDVLAFIQYARQFSQPLTQLSSIANIIQSTMASAERVFEILDEPEETEDETSLFTLEDPAGQVGFEHVTFGYEKDNPVINDLFIDILPGQTIAIVGPTGAGKTTLVNLLMRFYELDGGKITIDGVDITKLQRGKLRSLFGMVLQDTWLFHGTIRDNIAYGRLGASEQDIVQAAVAAHADHFIRTLPEGYDTVLNEEASNISQGQKQLLTIARAILADPPILILDEATSSVDTRTEVSIQKAMSTLMKGRTSFVIAHRLSTIRDADTILVMKNGRMIEQGTHQKLLAKNGFYHELYYSQFAGIALATEA